jgi:hypothetical protein
MGSRAVPKVEFRWEVAQRNRLNRPKVEHLFIGSLAVPIAHIWRTTNADRWVSFISLSDVSVEKTFMSRAKLRSVVEAAICDWFKAATH